MTPFTSAMRTWLRSYQLNLSRLFTGNSSVIYLWWLFPFSNQPAFSVLLSLTYADDFFHAASSCISVKQSVSYSIYIWLSISICFSYPSSYIIPSSLSILLSLFLDIHYHPHCNPWNSLLSSVLLPFYELKHFIEAAEYWSPAGLSWFWLRNSQSVWSNIHCLLFSFCHSQPVPP